MIFVLNLSISGNFCKVPAPRAIYVRISAFIYAFREKLENMDPGHSKARRQIKTQNSGVLGFCFFLNLMIIRGSAILDINFSTTTGSFQLHRALPQILCTAILHSNLVKA